MTKYKKSFRNSPNSKRNDYQTHHSHLADGSVAQYWAETQSSNRTKDIRARPCAIVFRRAMNEELKDMKRRLIRRARIVARWTFECSASCRKIPSIAQRKKHGLYDPAKEDNYAAG